MGRLHRLVIRCRTAPHHVDLRDLLWLIKKCGYVGRKRKGTSHRVFIHPTHVGSQLNIEEASGGKAKAYQVRQVLDQIDTFDLLSGELDED